MSLNGVRILVSGAARGIGAATARELAARGARCSLVGLEPSRLASLAGELGPGHAWFEADVTDQAALDRAVSATVERLGGIDVVVANAGVASLGTVATTDPDAFARTIDVNLTGVFRTLRAGLPEVVAQRGYLLIVASLASFAPAAGMAAYSASKAGAESLATCLRQEVAHRGVAVGCAHPSWIDTDLVRDAEADLPTFRAMRAQLPWPMRATTSPEVCAEALARGIERRASRIYVPRAIALLHWLRPLVAGSVGDRVARAQAARMVPSLEAEVAALGRSFATAPTEPERR